MSRGQIASIRRQRTFSLALAVSLIAGAALVASASGKSTALEDSVVVTYVGGTVQTALQTCAFDTFSQKTGVHVVYQAGASPGQNLARVAAQRSNPTTDVIFAGDPEQYIGTHHGFFAKLPYASIPNAKGIPASLRKKLRNGGFDRSGIPAFSQISGIEYNTAVFQEKGWAPPTSWSDLWDPRFHGHVALYSLLTANPQGLVVAASKIMGGNETHIAPGLAQLRKLEASNLVYPSASLLDGGFQNGSVWIAQNTGARSYLGKQQGLPVEFVQPKEGVVAFDIYLDIVNGAPHPNAARAFINWILTPSVQRCLAQATGWNPIVPSVAAQIPDSLANYSVPRKGKIVSVDWATVEHSLSSWLKQAPWLH